MSRISVVLNGPAVAGRGQWLADELGDAFAGARAGCVHGHGG